MCGIIGYLGKRDAIKEVTAGLQSLEYRGYDSAGIAYVQGGYIHTVKRVGHVAELVQATEDLPRVISLAIGHTRWATHGGATENNSHPHVSHDGTVAVAHNGIIENYAELRKDLTERGVVFKSDTDTEVIPNLIAISESGREFLPAVVQATKSLHGSYAFLAVSKKHHNQIVAVKNGSQPLVIGVNKDAVYISSDTPTLSAKCDKIYALEDTEFALVDAMGVKFFTNGKYINKQPLVLSAKAVAPTKGKYATFMEKEIREIPDVITNIAKTYADKDLTVLVDKIKACDTIHIAACGTSYHAGLYIARLFEARGIKRVIVHVASELPHANPMLSPRDIGLVISQSGETADTLLAMKMFKSNGLYTVAICNVEGSSIWRYADVALPTVAGVEVAVASTKAYIAQTLVGEVIANAVTGVPTDFAEYATVADEILFIAETVRVKAKQFRDIQKIFFLGKGMSTITALESALKVKEITYRHCEGISAGELKHGTLALVDDKTLCIVLTPTDAHAAGKLINSIQEVKSRGANVWVIPAVASSLGILFGQLFALFLAVELELNPDKPRNLAKSVTVE